LHRYIRTPKIVQENVDIEFNKVNSLLLLLSRGFGVKEFSKRKGSQESHYGWDDYSLDTKRRRW